MNKQEYEAKIIELVNENELLLKEQQEFQEALLIRCAEIQSMKPIKRFFQYGKLLWAIIELIMECVDKINQRRYNSK